MIRVFSFNEIYLSKIYKMEVEFEKAKALLLVQQYQINNLQKSANNYKDLLKNSKVHRMKIKDGKMNIKTQRSKFILATDSISLIGGSQNQTITIKGKWNNLTTEDIRFVSHDGHAEFRYETKNRPYNGCRCISLIMDNAFLIRTFYVPSNKEKTIYLANLEEFISIVNAHGG